MIFFTNATTAIIEDALDDFRETKKRLESECCDLKAGIKLCQKNSFTRIFLFPLEFCMKLLLKSKLRVVETFKPICQLLQQVWACIREENELDTEFKKMVNSDATALFEHLNENKMQCIYVEYLKKSPFLLSAIRQEILFIKQDTAIDKH